MDERSLIVYPAAWKNNSPMHVVVKALSTAVNSVDNLQTIENCVESYTATEHRKRKGIVEKEFTFILYLQ